MGADIPAGAAPADVAAVVQDLATAPLLRFRDWEHLEPRLPHQSGVYTIWDGPRLLYAGKATGQYGLRGRLRQHASGNHFGSDFCRLAWGKHILPALTPEEREALAESQRSIPEFVRDRMRRSYSFRVAIAESDALAARAETLLRRGELHPGRRRMWPILNPMSPEGKAGNANPAASSDLAQVWAIVQEYRAVPGARRSMLPASPPAVKANLAALADAPATRKALQEVGVEQVRATITTGSRPAWLADLRANQGKPGHYGRAESTVVNGVAIAAVWAASSQAAE